MRTIETNIMVTSDGKAVVELQLPPTASARKYRAVIILSEQAMHHPGTTVTKQLPTELPVHDFGPWPAGLSLRREDL
jgi:hypothetical protein